MVSMIFGLLLVVIAVRLVISILVNPGLLLRIVLGFGLLVLASIVALALTIGQFVSHHAPHIGVSMPGVTVNPTGVHVYSGTGESVKVTPFGVEIDGRTRANLQGTWTDSKGVAYRHVDPAAAGPNILRQLLPDASDSASVAALSDETAEPFVVQAEAPEQPVSRNGKDVPSSPPWMFDRALTDAAWQAGARSAPVQAEVPEQSAGPTADAQPQRLLSDHFDPDVYQSEGAAVRGLTSQVAKLLDTVTPGAQEPNPIVIQGKISTSLMQEVQGILAKAFPSAWVHWSKGSVQVDDRTVIVYASREPEEGSEGSASRGNTDGSPQVLRMDITGAKGKTSRSARFLDKPWVDDFATFASNNRERTWVMAMSRNPAVSAAEAEQQALNDAVTQLEPRVRDRLAYFARDGESLLQRQIRAGLESSGMIADRFVQRFERPYGEIWQVGLLVDASSKKIGFLADKCDRVLAVQQRTFRQTVLSIAGLVALVCVVYIFLNSITKGYFVWSLRTAALAIIAGGIFLVLLLSHNEPAIGGFLR